MECCASSPDSNPVEHFGISSDVLSAHQWTTTTAVAKLRQILVEELGAWGPEGHMWPVWGRGGSSNCCWSSIFRSTMKLFWMMKLMFVSVLWIFELQNVYSLNYLLIRNGNTANFSHPLWLCWSWYKSMTLTNVKLLTQCCKTTTPAYFNIDTN